MERKKYMAYVGTYTHGKSKGIEAYSIDTSKGFLTKHSEVKVSNASYTTPSKKNKILYSIEDDGVVSFNIGEDGSLTRKGFIDIDGMRGCYIHKDQNEKYLYVGGYHDGKITMIELDENGNLLKVNDGIYHKGLGSVAERNFRPHVSCVKTTPDNKFICAVDNGIDQVKIYSINLNNKLSLVDIIRCPRESGPRNLIFNPTKPVAYLLMELTNEIMVYSYDTDGKAPNFQLIQTIKTVPKDSIHNASCAFAITRDGNYLFSSVAGENAISMFKIMKDGTLNRIFTLPISGDYPKDITLLPGDKFIAVANHSSNSITVFKIDYEKGIIVMNGKPLSIETPNSIKIVEL